MLSPPSLGVVTVSRSGLGCVGIWRGILLRKGSDSAVPQLLQLDNHFQVGMLGVILVTYVGTPPTVRQGPYFAFRIGEIDCLFRKCYTEDSRRFHNLYL